MHTLYHVRNLNSVLNFLRINLKSYGTLVITTKSMHTLPWTETVFTDIVKKLKIDKYTKIKPVRDESHFCLENAECILHKAFSKSHYSIKKYVIETQLLVDSHRSFLKYIASTSRYSLDDKISKELGKKYWATWKKELEKQQLILDKFIEVIFIIKKR